jgi:hypothetical protein
MPVVEVFMRRGRSPQRVEAITDALHDALVEAYEVPRGDRFQIVHQDDAHELVFDTDFMGGPRTDQFVLVRVMAGKPRPIETKRKLFALMAEYLEQRAGVAQADIFILVDNVQLSDISMSHGRPYDVALAEQLG